MERICVALVDHARPSRHAGRGGPSASFVRQLGEDFCRRRNPVKACAMADWTLEQVADRFAEAADVQGRLPERRVRGYFNTWPDMKTRVQRSRWPAPSRCGHRRRRPRRLAGWRRRSPGHAF